MEQNVETFQKKRGQTLLLGQLDLMYNKKNDIGNVAKANHSELSLEKAEAFIVNNRQHYFFREIERLNYNRDEAYAAIVNSKRRFSHYTELEAVINYVFDERPRGRMYKWHKGL